MSLRVRFCSGIFCAYAPFVGTFAVRLYGFTLQTKHLHQNLLIQNTTFKMRSMKNKVFM